jgi:hypothetical protein
MDEENLIRFNPENTESEKPKAKSNNILHIFINIGLLVLFALLGIFLIILYTNKTSGNSTPLIQSAIEVNPEVTGFSLENAPTNSLTGQISSMSGTVRWESRVATEASVITAPQNIKQGEKIVTDIDGSVNLIISSGSAVMMPPNTDVDFVQLLPENLILAQNTGEVSFTKTDDIPLTVRSLGMIIRFTRGKFTITVDPINGFITVTDHEGDVTVAYNNNQYVSKVWGITTGQTLVYNNVTRRVSIE